MIEFKTEDVESTDGVISKDVKCPFTLTFVDGSKMVSVFATPPPFWVKRYIIANIEGTSFNRISIVWNGCLLPFKSTFDAEGVTLKSRNVGQEYPEYYRYLRDINIADDAYALSLFSDKIFACSPIVVRIVKTPADDTMFQRFMQRLKLLSNVHVEV